VIALPVWAPWALAGALAIGGFALYERGEARVQAARVETAEARKAFETYKLEQAEAVQKQAVSIMQAAADRAAVHLENVRGLVAIAETGKKEISSVVVTKDCERDALSDATAAAVQRLWRDWREREAGAGAVAADRRGAAGKVP
jgi:DNA-binding protein YbaB